MTIKTYGFNSARTLTIFLGLAGGLLYLLTSNAIWSLRIEFQQLEMISQGTGMHGGESLVTLDGTDGDDTDNDIQTHNDELSIISDKGDELEEIEEETHHILLRTLHNTELHAMDSKCPANIRPDSITTTLVLQTTVNRLPFLFETCSRWSINPIIVVVYIAPSNTDDDAYQLDEGEEGDEDYWEDTKQTFQKACPNAVFIPHLGQSRTERTMEYPVNKLRNLGLDEVQTSHVLLLDVDFIPSDDLDTRIDEVIITRSKQEVLQHGGRDGAYGGTSLVQKDAIVIPAFERTTWSGKPCKTIVDCILNLDMEDVKTGIEDHDEEKIIANRYIPGTMDELKDCYALSHNTTTTNNTTTTRKNRGCNYFQEYENWDGHSSTRTEEWLQTRKTLDTSSLMRRLPCFDTDRYEPYVVLPWCPASLMNLRQSSLLTNTNKQQQPQLPQRIYPISPYYDERFYGYGKNKIQQISHLRVKGYNFLVLPPKGFVIHRPHPPSATKKIWRKTSVNDLREKMDILYPKYLKELQKRYRDINISTNDTRIGICQK